MDDDRQSGSGLLVVHDIVEMTQLTGCQSSFSDFPGEFRDRLRVNLFRTLEGPDNDAGDRVQGFQRHVEKMGIDMSFAHFPFAFLSEPSGIADEDGAFVKEERRAMEKRVPIRDKVFDCLRGLGE